MKRLLRTYGNEICLLDATCKTTRYVLPLFFMVIKTNVDYEVVGEFVCEGGETELIRSALKILKSWTPRVLMTVLSDMFNKKVTVIIGVNLS